MLKVGDVIAVHTRWAILSWAIRRLTRSFWNHCALYVGNGMMIEAIGKGVTLRPVIIYEGRRRKWVVKAFRPPCTAAIKEKAVAYARGKNGLKYDHWLVLGILAAIKNYKLDRKNEWGHDKRFGCSELVGKAYADAGFHFANPGTIHVSNLAPGDIFETPGGEWVKGWPR